MGETRIEMQGTGRLIAVEELHWSQYCRRVGDVQATRMDVPFRVLRDGGVVRRDAGAWLVEGNDGELRIYGDGAFRKLFVPVAEGWGEGRASAKTGRADWPIRPWCNAR